VSLYVYVYLCADVCVCVTICGAQSGQHFMDVDAHVRERFKLL
jgi:hypothetical protein